VGERSAIEWTDATWTPIRARFLEIQNDGSGKERIGWHCTHASEGCRFCYAEKINHRLGTGRAYAPDELYREDRKGYRNGEVHVFLNETMLLHPVKWRRPRRIFVCSMTDLFADFVSDDWIARIVEIMTATPRHAFQVLTKRPDRMLQSLASITPMPHVWIGTSVEDQKRADERREPLRALAEAGWNTWVSYEPALGPVDWSGWEFIRWMVSGGESGPNARPSHPDWHRAARDFCQAHDIPYFFKQHGSWLSILDRDNDDPDWRGPYSRWEQSDRHQFLNLAGGCGFHGERLHVMERVGKNRAGALLDGREHREMPDRPNA
jgi:protein gp37